MYRIMGILAVVIMIVLAPVFMVLALIKTLFELLGAPREVKDE